MGDKNYVLNPSPKKFPLALEDRGNDWHFGLCGCFGDCVLCCFAHHCLCCLVSQNSADLDGNPNTCGCCYAGSFGKNRLQAVAQFGIRTNMAFEIFACCFFPCCSEVQVAREIKWHATNVKAAPQVQMMAVTPPTVMMMQSPLGVMNPMVVQMSPGTPQHQQVAYSPVYQGQQPVYQQQQYPTIQQPQYQPVQQQPPVYQTQPQGYTLDPNQSQPSPQQWPSVEKPKAY